jgi:putative membrane protein
MSDALLIVGSALILLAGLFHVYVFYMESITWLTPKTWKTFGLPSQEVAQIIAPMAFNQGFYNLFLAIGSVGGLVLVAVNSTIGHTLMIFSALSMVAAGAVLFFSVKTSRRAAIIQAGPPLLGVISLLLSGSL